jgi:hypothetical protein
MGSYFTHFAGKSIRLPDGPDDASKGIAALARFQELMQVSANDHARKNARTDTPFLRDGVLLLLDLRLVIRGRDGEAQRGERVQRLRRP